MFSVQVCNRIIFFVGCFLLVVGFLFTGLWEPLYQNIVMSRLKITNNSEAYSLWKETVVPIYIKFHLFNWTNPERSLAKMEKPHFEQKGPYVFREYRYKEDIEWNLSNDTVTFYNVHKWIHMPEMSNGSLSDTITNINVIAVAFGSLLKDLNIFQKIAIDKIIEYNEKSLYVTKTVKELLFDGYDDKLLDLGKEIEPLIHINIPYDKFGWWYGRNMTKGGALNMYTGVKDMNYLGDVYSWNYKRNVDAYNGYCSVVNGTTGEIWPIDAAYRDIASIFVPDLCSSISLTNNGSATAYGIPGTKFIGLEDMFDNGTKSNESRCYCPNDECQLPSGVRNVSSCLGAVPAFISYPHFYLADESYLQDISGMDPDASKHTFYIILEKRTSIVIEAHARLQMNILLEPIEHVKMLQDVPKVMIPTFWFEQYTNMTPSLINNVNTVTQIIPKVLSYIGLSLVCFGSIFLIAALIINRSQYLKPTYTERL